jgi:hypothetical protein
MLEALGDDRDVRLVTAAATTASAAGGRAAAVVIAAARPDGQGERRSSDCQTCELPLTHDCLLL